MQLSKTIRLLLWISTSIVLCVFAGALFAPLIYSGNSAKYGFTPRGVTPQVKTYQSDSLGFQFQYPADLFLQPSGISEGHLLDVALTIPGALTDESVAFLNVQKTSGTDIRLISFDFEAWYKRPVSILSKRQIVLDGSPALITEIQNHWLSNGHDTWVQLIHKDRLLTFTSQPYAPGSKQGSAVYLPEADNAMSLFISTLQLVR